VGQDLPQFGSCVRDSLEAMLLGAKRYAFIALHRFTHALFV